MAKMQLNEKQIISTFMAVHGENFKTVADKIGINNRTLSNQFGRPDSTLTLSTVYALMKAMGAEIVFRDKEGLEVVLSEDTAAIDVSEVMKARTDAVRAENIKSIPRKKGGVEP